MAITVRGIPEVQKYLQDFPQLLIMGCFAKALSRAIAVFEEELARTCPRYVPLDTESELTTSAKKYGTLRDNLLSTVTLDSRGRGGKAQVGFSRAGFVAMMLEFGHRVAVGGTLDTKKRKGTGRQAGYVEANPFMRRAFARCADKAFDVFVEEVRTWMEKN